MHVLGPGDSHFVATLPLQSVFDIVDQQLFWSTSGVFIVVYIRRSEEGYFFIFRHCNLSNSCVLVNTVSNDLNICCESRFCFL